LKSCKLTLSLINVLSLQFTSRFLDLTLGSWAGCIQHSCHW